MKIPYITGFAVILLVIFGCTYSLRMNQYPHLRDVMIVPFENDTVELYLEEDLRNSIITSFQQDGRLGIAYEEPDSRIEGKLLEYSDTIYGYDIDQNIQEYQVKLVMSITFTDLVRNAVIWENKSLALTERYSPEGAGSAEYDSEEEARNEIYRELFRIIIRNSLEAW
jgi:hypothetical protein